MIENCLFVCLFVFLFVFFFFLFIIPSTSTKSKNIHTSPKIIAQHRKTNTVCSIRAVNVFGPSKEEEKARDGDETRVEQQGHSGPFRAHRSGPIIDCQHPNGSSDACNGACKHENEPNDCFFVSSVVENASSTVELRSRDQIHQHVGDGTKDCRKRVIPHKRSRSHSNLLIGVDDSTDQNEPCSREQST